MPEINVPLLEQTLAQIEAHPETWDQGSFRCGTGMCFAGWTAELAGGKWLTSADAECYADRLVPEGSDGNDVTEEDCEGCDSPPPPPGVFAEVRAKRLLGLDARQSARLFDGSNGLDVIRALVAELKVDAAEQSSPQGSGDA